ncbi:MAG: type II secretion system protein GspG [Planctomycetota bacterium]
MTRAAGARGFTLLEMIVVVAILLLLAGIAVPLVATELRRARWEATVEEMKRLAAALENFFADTLVVPRSLDLLVERPERIYGWCGPYVSPGSGGPEGHLNDAWDRPYSLSRESASRIVLRSGGDDVDSPEDDLVQEIDFTPIRRKVTLERLAIVNAALTRYLRDDIQEPPATNVTLLLNRLIGYGYLSDDSRWRVDAWGDEFVADPIGGRPIVKVTSIHFLPPPGETEGGGGGQGGGNGESGGPHAGNGGGQDGGDGGNGNDGNNGGQDRPNDTGIQLPPGFDRGKGKWKTGG